MSQIVISALDREKILKHFLLVLNEHPNLNKYKLKESLVVVNLNYSTSAINSILYSTSLLFAKNDDKLPLWRLTSYASGLIIDLLQNSESSYSSSINLKYYHGHTPRTWQIEAFQAWKARGYRGIIEAVTGTGKTLVGVLAAADAVERGLDVLIIVPGIELLNQWYEILKKTISDKLHIGKIGDGLKSDFHHNNIIITTVQSASIDKILPVTSNSLLIADEVHRYGSAKFSLALDDVYKERLGLTATLERLDNAVEQVLIPYFAPVSNKFSSIHTVIEGCGYARGLDDGILAPFRIGLIGVDLEVEEYNLYSELDEKISKVARQLVYNHGCPFQPFGEFIKAVTLLSKGGHNDYIGTNLARRYLDFFTKRRAVLANSTAKAEILSIIKSIFDFSEKSLIFTELEELAVKSVEILSRVDVDAAVFSSSLNTNQRKELLRQFKSKEIKVLAAPKVLDEGIDVPDADLGVILSASHSKRQMIQRMGRIIRPKKDKRTATFVIIYARFTNEDPDNGTHEGFLNEMYDNAEDVQSFTQQTILNFQLWYLKDRLSMYHD